MQILDKMNEVEKFLMFLLEKLYIFDKKEKCEIGNEIGNIQEIHEKIKCLGYVNKKLKEIDYVIIAKEVITKFKCYNILDLDYEYCLNEVGDLYNQYKTYKQTSSKNETCKKEKQDCCEQAISQQSISQQAISQQAISQQAISQQAISQQAISQQAISQQADIDTAGTEYIYSLEEIDTEMLIKRFGELLRVGAADDKFRYEYKLEYIHKGNKYIYSIYDYVNSSNNFYVEADIYWHVASECKDKRINNQFKKELLVILKQE